MWPTLAANATSGDVPPSHTNLGVRLTTLTDLVRGLASTACLLRFKRNQVAKLASRIIRRTRTASITASESLRLQRMPRQDDSPWLAEELLLSARDRETMAMGFYSDAVHRSQKPTKLWMVDKAIRGITSPKKSSRLFFNLSTFREYGNLWTANADFSSLKKLTDVNPQQKQFRWGDSELVRWTDGNGDRRTGPPS